MSSLATIPVPLGIPTNNDCPSALPTDAGVNPRAETIKLLRGGFTLPIIATLGTRGVIQRLLDGQIDLAPTSGADLALAQLLDFLASQGLLLRTAGPDRSGSESNRASVTYIPSRLGRSILRRWGSFAILNSYSDYFRHLDSWLDTGAFPGGIAVRREENVIGSAEAHRNKFFPVGLDFTLGTPVDVLIELGCGVGHFASAMCERHVPRLILGVDLDPEVVKLFERHVSPLALCKGCAADAFDVETWGAAATASAAERVVISLWFVLHEFCAGSTEKARLFFETVRRSYPSAELLLGEVVSHPPERLSANHAVSILPEMQLFHAMSRQGLLSWPQFVELRREIPYEIVAERRFDPVYDEDGTAYPSNLIWHLRPR
jgi:hypothetical protein